jgi:hypothetical protein
MPFKTVPRSPSRFRGTLGELTEKHLISVMPTPIAVKHFHEQLRAYCARPAPLMLLRYRKIEERCTDLPAENGAVVRWTDNSPAWEIHHAAFQGFTWSPTEFDSFVRSVPCRMFAAKNRSINKSKWYVAHIFPVKADRRNAAEMTHTERIARFVRNVHPANHFYFPSDDSRVGRLYGEHPQVIEYVAGLYRERYAAIWPEFLELAMAQDFPSASSDLGDLRIDFHLNAGQVKAEKTSGSRPPSKAIIENDLSLSANELSGRLAISQESEFEILWEEFLHRRDIGQAANALESIDRLLGAHSLFERTLKAVHPDCPPTVGKQETSLITRINRFPGVETSGGVVMLINKDDLVAAVFLRNKMVHATVSASLPEAREATRVLIEAAGRILGVLSGRSVDRYVSAINEDLKNHLCDKLSGDCGRGDLNWVGNDTSQRLQTGLARENAISLIMRLSWRRSRDLPERFIGCYRLNLVALEAGGYIRKEATSGKYRIRIVHELNDDLYLQLNDKEPRIWLERFASVDPPH